MAIYGLQLVNRSRHQERYYTFESRIEPDVRSVVETLDSLYNIPWEDQDDKVKEVFKAKRVDPEDFCIGLVVYTFFLRDG